MDDFDFSSASAINWRNRTQSKDFKRLRDADIYPEINTWIRANAIKNLVDIGSGDGSYASQIAVERYIGVEPSTHLLPLGIGVWHLLKDLERANLELNRVLKSSGKFLIFVANPESDWPSNYESFEQNGDCLVGTKDGKTDRIFLRSRQCLLHYFTEAGLCITNFKSVRNWLLIFGVKVS